jgi:hypothetical protein
LEVQRAQASEALRAEWGERDANHAMVVRVSLSLDETGGCGSIDELDGAVVACGCPKFGHVVDLRVRAARSVRKVGVSPLELRLLWLMRSYTSGRRASSGRSCQQETAVRAVIEF